MDAGATGEVTRHDVGHCPDRCHVGQDEMGCAGRDMGWEPEGPNQ
jgi:hypothetical protein